MILSSKDAAGVLHKKYPSLKITEAYIYDKNYYLFTAKEDPNKQDANDPFYIVDMRNGNLFNISPFTDIDKFNDALENHPIKVPKE